MVRWARLVLAVAVVVVASGCTSSDPLVDGVRVGIAVECPSCDQPLPPNDGCGKCDSVADLARTAFLHWSDLGTDYRMSYHEEGCANMPLGTQCLITRSGAMYVVVAEWSGGARHAVAIHCGVGGCRYMADYRS